MGGAASWNHAVVRIPVRENTHSAFSGSLKHRKYSRPNESRLSCLHRTGASTWLVETGGAGVLQETCGFSWNVLARSWDSVSAESAEEEEEEKKKARSIMYESGSRSNGTALEYPPLTL